MYLLLLELQAVSMDYTLLEFSQEAGYLSLSHYSRAKLKIPVEKLYIGKSLSLSLSLSLPTLLKLSSEDFFSLFFF